MILRSGGGQPLLIGTYGDSITDSGKYGQVMGPGNGNQEWYQYFMYIYLLVRNINTYIFDFGVASQKIEEICYRLRNDVGYFHYNYIVILAGTNNIFANKNSTIISDIAISEYNLTITSIEAYYNSVGWHDYTFIICSIPPVSSTINLNGLSGIDAAQIIKEANVNIRTFIEGLQNSKVKFCDVHRHLTGIDNTYYMNGLTYDGIHPSTYGNAVVGFALSEKIVENFYQW
ncbi:MAG TPA: SGNH/GDSL hydrolase family protein [Saprospiraceae bacterium]|nr:SGNH/GDSL hydrolase family protein [Saprospiraceae bacterium]